MDAILKWIETSTLYPKFFWKSKSSKIALAALGKQNESFTVPEFSEQRMYGGCFFSKSSPTPILWEDFPPLYFFQPLHEKTSHSPLVSPPPELNWTITNREDRPNQATWCHHVAMTQQKITNKQINKAVLARITTLHFETDVNGWDLLRHLLTLSFQTTLFAYQPTPNALFLGATPEHLYQRKGNLLTSESLAGTCSLETPDELLQNSFKDRQEFLIVKDAITESLAPLCSSLQWNHQDSILRTNKVKHLHNTLEAKLKHTVTDAELISILHPSAAMGGMPKKEALTWIAQTEPFTRGHYAAPIGWISKKEAEVAVGIRSCLFKDKQLHIFSGAGLVAQSNPLEEWQELEMKISPIFNLISPKNHELCSAHH
jgi:menaquinone-specific isochorismate synthase